MPNEEFGQGGANPQFGGNGNGHGSGGAFPGFSTNTPKPVGASVVGTDPKTNHADHQHPFPTVNGINTGGSQLSAFASATYTEGARVWVESVGAWFQLYQSALAVDGIAVIAASGKAGWQWQRINTINRNFWPTVNWSIDPVAGNDENNGLTDGTALKTMQELSRRLYNAHLAQNTTFRILGNVDSASWTFLPLANITVTVLGVLGAANQLFSGAITSVTVAAAGPGTGDNNFGDTSIPVSFTASGLLATGVLFTRTSGAQPCTWGVVKDLGGKTARMTKPIALSGAARTLAVNDTYTANTLPQVPLQRFGAAQAQVGYNFILDTGNGGQGANSATPNTILVPRYNGCWFNSIGRVFVGSTHDGCMFACGGTPSAFTFIGNYGAGQVIQACGFVGTGAATVSFNNSAFQPGTSTFQGVGITNDNGNHMTVAGDVYMNDCSVPLFNVKIGTDVKFENGAIVGSGNTSNLFSISGGGRIIYGLLAGANPPCVAGSTSGTQIAVNGSTFTVAQLPVLMGDDGCGMFVSAPAQVHNSFIPFKNTANGVQAIVIGNTGPGAIVTPGTPAGYLTFKDAAGVTSYIPYWQ